MSDNGGCALALVRSRDAPLRGGEETVEFRLLNEFQRTDGVLKRFGVIVRHHELGFRANAMVVWDVPEDSVSELGTQLAVEPGVTLCYRRERRLPRWRYNLFCMIHGSERAQVERHIETLRARLNLRPYPHAVLFSTRRFKQCGARYSSAAEQCCG